MTGATIADAINRKKQNMPSLDSGKTGVHPLGRSRKGPGRPFALVALLLGLAGCADLPPREPAAPSPCSIHEASWECQIERYREVSQ